MKARIVALLLLSGAFVLTAGAIACGSGGDSGPSLIRPVDASTSEAGAPIARAEPTVCDCALSDSAVFATATAEAGAAAGATSLSVGVFEFGYTPAALTAPAGRPVTIAVRNTGTAAHTFTITGTAESRIAAGSTAEVRFTAPQSGVLTFFCTIHGRDVMSGTLTVTP